MTVWKQAVRCGYEVYALQNPPAGSIVLIGPDGTSLYLDAKQTMGLYQTLHSHHDTLMKKEA